MKLPDHLQTIGVFSPASANVNQPERLQLGRQRLAQLGATLVEPELATPPLRQLAASDQARLQQLETLLNNPEVDAIIATRGGYGCSRLLDGLDWNLLRSRNLPLIGYSDVTSLHLAALKHGCRNHLYGPMVASTFGNPSPDANPAIDALLRQLQLVPEPDLLAFGSQNITVLKPGTASAPLVPACLSVLVSLLGTPHLPDLSRHILALEDVDEPSYRIDRMLQQLRQAGILQKLAGLAFGTFKDCENAHFLPEILAEYAAYVNGPVIANLPFGHQQPAVTLPVGAIVTLQAEPGSPVSLRRAPLDQFQSQIHTSPTTGKTLGYRWLEPRRQDTGERFPLVVFLHGAGERGEDNALQLVHCLPHFVKPENQRRFPCFVCAPQCPAGQQWVNVPWNQTQHTMPEAPSAPMAQVCELLDELIANYPIDTQRIYVMGISMGGFGTWDLVSRQPRRFAAAVPICGGADLQQLPKLAHLPIWTFHGDSDTVVLTSRSRDAASVLAPLNPDGFIYTEVPNCGHDAWNPAFNNPQLLPWLFSQRQA